MAETISINNDIPVFYIKASSFPNGVLAAHQQLHKLVPFSTERRYFGLSRPEQGRIVYHAAAEELKPGEGKALGCETMLIKKGNYLSVIIKDYMKDVQGIQRAFEDMIKDPNIDPQGYCVEWYLNDKDVECMVRLK